MRGLWVALAATAVASALGSMASAQVCAPTQGMMAEWNFQGGSVADSTGHGNNSWTGVAMAPGIVGDGAWFDGSGMGLPSIADSPWLNPASAITLMAWYKPVSYSGTGNESIVRKELVPPTTAAVQYQLASVGDASPLPGHGSFAFSLVLNGSNQARIQTNAGFWTPGTWYFIVGTYDGAVMRLYVNAAPVAAQAASGPIGTFAGNTRIGYGPFAPSLRGTIDQVRIFDRALSPADIQWWYAHPEGFPVAVHAGVAHPTPCAGWNIGLWVDADPSLTSFQWRLNGVDLADAPGHIVGSGTPTLALTGVTPADSGSYDCVVGNALCSAASTPASMVVTTCCPADIDDGTGTGTRDGGIDINDLLYFLAAYEAGDWPADLDDGSGTGTPDGGVDINDLLFFLAHYEAGC